MNGVFTPPEVSIDEIRQRAEELPQGRVKDDFFLLFIEIENRDRIINGITGTIKPGIGN